MKQLQQKQHNNYIVVAIGVVVVRNSIQIYHSIVFNDINIILLWPLLISFIKKIINSIKIVLLVVVVVLINIFIH